MKSKFNIKFFVVLCFLTIGLLVYSNSNEDPAQSSVSNLGPVTPKDTIYQIITDRFYDGDPSNNQPPNSDPALFDGTGTDLKLYQGGDFKGIIEKIPYLKEMGVTAVWISPPYENRDTVIEDYQPDGTVNVWSSFHGYHARNYFRTNPRFGTMQDFEELREALHDNGIKLVIDFVSNHTSRWQNPTLNFAPEYGYLYEPDKDELGNYCFDEFGEPADCSGDGKTEYLVADPHNDVDQWFHGLGDRGNDTSRFGYRYKDLASLADFNHENPLVIEHLYKAIQFWKEKGIDGIRHDATLHVNPAFMKGFKDYVDSLPGGPLTHFGEFFIGRPAPKYDEYRTFPDRTGVHNLDFEFYRSVTSTFGDFSKDMNDFAQMLMYTSTDYKHEHQALTFIDNHDVTRFRYIQPNNKVLHVALAALMLSRGTPNIYYGTEQYLTSDDPSDIAGRVFMQKETDFNTNTVAFQVISKLASLRQENDAIAFGLTSILHSDEHVLVMQRKFFDKEVIVALNRHPDQLFYVPSLNVSLPNGTYQDVLDGLLDGRTIQVQSGTIPGFMINGGEVSVWSYNPDLGPNPKIGTVISTIGRPGNEVYILGSGLDGQVQVLFDQVLATIINNQEDMIRAIVPQGVSGEVEITVVKNGVTSNGYAYDVLSGEQVQVVFHVEAHTNWGENIYIVGNIPELGNWDPYQATEAMLNPDYPHWFLPVSVPAGTTFEFKFIKIDQQGHVTWESGPNRIFQSSVETTGVEHTPLYNFRN